jgi:hypothetical protein
MLVEAEKELDDTIGYHEEIEPGLGLRLKAEAREVQGARREAQGGRAKGQKANG